MFIKKYSTESIINSTLLSIGSRIAPILISLFSIPYIINTLGEEKFGVLTIAWVFIGYFNLFDLGIGRAITKMVSERLGQDREDEINEVFSTGVITTFLLGLIGAIIFFLISKPITSIYLNIPEFLLPEVLTGLIFLSLGMPFTILINSFIGSLEALHEFKILTITQILFSAFTYLGLISILFFTSNLAFLIAFLSILKFIHCTVYFVIVKRRFKFKKLGIENYSTHLKAIFSFGGWVTVSSILSPLMTVLDRFIIGLNNSMSNVTYYSTSNELVQRAGIFPSSIVNVLFPVVSFEEKRMGDKKFRIYSTSFGIVTLISILIAVTLIVFGKEILSVWISKSFSDNSYSLLQIITVGAVYNFMARTPYMFIQGNGKPDVTAKLHVIELLFYIPLLYFLLTEFLVIGVAMAASIRMFFDFIALHIYSHKKLKTDLHLRLILVGTLIPIVIAFGINFYISIFYFKAIVFLIFMISIIALFWVFVFDKTVKNRVKSRISQIGFARGI